MTAAPRYTLTTAGAQPAKPARRSPGKYLTPTSKWILRNCYPGQVMAAVIERALRRMAINDGHQLTGRRPS